MRREIVLAGVGGQGLLTLAAVISRAALGQGLVVKQSEVHGMSQRGGAVESHVRISDRPIHSPVIPKGRADLILAMAPMEGLRHLEYLGKDGAVVVSSVPVKNIDNYPDEAAVIAAIESLPVHRLIDAPTRAREAGSVRSANMVLLGAGARFIGLAPGALEQAIEELFAARSPGLAAANLKAFRIGLAAR